MKDQENSFNKIIEEVFLPKGTHKKHTEHHTYMQNIQNTKQIGPEKKVLLHHNNQNSKHIEQRKIGKLKAVRQKDKVTHKGVYIRFIINFFMETRRARKTWRDVLKTKRPRVLVQTTIPSKTFNHNRWEKNQDIP